MLCLLSRRKPKPSVSMKSDLEGRNNKSIWDGITSAFESQ